MVNWDLFDEVVQTVCRFFTDQTINSYNKILKHIRKLQLRIRMTIMREVRMTIIAPNSIVS